MAWVAEELGLLLVEDGDGGEVRVLVGGYLPGSPPAPGRDLPSLLRRVCRLEADVPVDELVDQARGGVPGALQVEAPIRGQILAWPTGPQRARALVVPDAAEGRRATLDRAAGVTHEVANALTAIAGWSRLAATGGPLPARTRHALDVVERSASDALRAARGLLRTFRADGEPRRTSDAAADLARVVHEAVDELAPRIQGASLDLTVESPPEAWAAVREEDARLIVRNLLRNAVEAVGPRGAVEVRLVPEGRRVHLAVADDGPGMSEEVLAQAFDRYFTTKGEGTGLGLAMVRETVAAVGGELSVESAAGRGARFDVRLPGMARRRSRPSSPRAVEPVSRTVPTIHGPLRGRSLPRGLRVLLVDDDPAVRSLLQTSLELRGMDVRAAEDRAAALELEGTFDLALVDLQLGDERGDGLVAELMRLGRARRSVLMTGIAEPDLTGSPAPDALLRKPFELDDLDRVLGELIDLPRAAGG